MVFSITLHILPALHLPGGRTPDLAQLVVVVHVAQQTEGEDDGTGGNGELAVVPVGGGDGPVRGQPATQAGGVADLEAQGGKEEDGVDGRHGRVEDERGEKGSIEVVDRLCSLWSVRVTCKPNTFIYGITE